MHYDKLVRDKIPEILQKKGIEFSTHVASDDEYKTKLIKKLREEVDEFTEENNIEELADIEEVLLAIRKLFNLSKAEIEKIRQDKAEKRGGFHEKIILEKTE